MDKIKLKITGLCVGLLGSIGVMIYTLAATNPTDIGPSGVTFWFINLLVLLSCMLSLLLIILSRKYKKADQQPNKTVNTSFRTGFLISIAIVTFLALKTLGSLSVKDVVLLSLVIVVIELFLRTRRVAND